MNLFNGLWRKFRSLWQRGDVKQEIDEELQFHLQQRTAENVAAGMSPEDAAREARRRFGNVQGIREECRERRGVSFGETLWQDIRFGLRMLRRNPGFTTVAVVSLALGIGAGTAVFSLVNAILLQTLPVPNPHELRALRWTGTDCHVESLWDSGPPVFSGNRQSAHAVSPPTFLNLREQGAAQADIFGFFPLQNVTARLQGEAFTANGVMVSDNFFSGLGVQPFIGQLFRPGDKPDAGPQVVITYDWWERHLARDPGVVGRAVALNGTEFTIIGVLPKGFVGVWPGNPWGVYVPMAVSSQPLVPLFQPFNSSRVWYVRLMARLRPGVSEAQLGAALNVIFAREAGGVMNEPKLLVEPGSGGVESDRNKYQRPLLLILGVVGMVMLVACANLAGLSLARGAARRHELAVRAALGASRWRLMRQSFTESLVLALLGGGLGVLLSLWGRTAMSRLLAGSTEGLHYDFSLDFTVLGFGLAAALITALLTGLLPALKAGKADPMESLKSRGALNAPRLQTGKALVVAQVCLSVLLLTGAGLYVRTLVNLTHIDTGFRAENLLLFQFNLNGALYEGAEYAAFFQRVESRLAAIPGVRSATYIQHPLLGNRRSSGRGGVTFLNSPVTLPRNMPNSRLTVGEKFFETMGVPMLNGRGFTAADSANAPKVLVINETFARNYLPNIDPVGLTVRYNQAEWRIVGVCRDAKYDNLKEPAPPTLYFPIQQSFYGSYQITSGCFAVRTALPPLALTSAVRRAVAEVDPNVPVSNVTTQVALRDKGISQEWLFAALCSALAGLALLLSCIGLYGLMAYHVARRTGEIAVRMALGATRGHIVGPVLREALLLTVVGLAIGVPVAFTLTKYVRSQLYGVQPNDPVTFISAAVLLIVVAVLAAWIPARRAAKVDPMQALRSE